MDEERIETKVISVGDRSIEIAELAKALCAAQALMGPAIKDRENPFFKSTYADLASVWEACRGPLTANGLSVAQLPSAVGPVVTVATFLIHTSGQFIQSNLSMKAEKDTPQAIGSAITYARRYALAAIVGIASGDDDGETASKNKPTVAKPQKKSESGSNDSDTLLAGAKENLEKCKKLFGDENFFRILGGEGYESIEQITDPVLANGILKKMRAFYDSQKKAGNGK